MEQESVRENAAIVNELQHINLEAITKKDTTPKIVSRAPSSDPPPSPSQLFSFTVGSKCVH